MDRNEEYMKQALSLAREASEMGEVPVGCVIVSKHGEIIGRGKNQRERRNNAILHAEIEAIDNACKAKGNWRLSDCTMFVTLEPCPMCAGAIMNARIPRLYFGARDKNFGACGGVINLFEENFHCKPAIIGGILEDECTQLLQDFFIRCRKEK